MGPGFDTLWFTSGAVRHGTEYTVFQATQIDSTSDFADSERPQTPLLDFDLIRDEDRFRIKADAKSFATIADDEWETDIAQRIDRTLYAGISFKF